MVQPHLLSKTVKELEVRLNTVIVSVEILGSRLDTLMTRHTVPPLNLSLSETTHQNLFNGLKRLDLFQENRVLTGNLRSFRF